MTKLEKDFEQFIADHVPRPSKAINELWMEGQLQVAAVIGFDEEELVNSLTRDFIFAAAVFEEELLQRAYEQGCCDFCFHSPTWLCLCLEAGITIEQLRESELEPPWNDQDNYPFDFPADDNASALLTILEMRRITLRGKKAGALCEACRLAGLKTENGRGGD